MNTSLSSKIESQQSVDDEDVEVSNTEDEDVLVPPNLETSKQSFLGRIRTCSNVTIIEWSFIIISAIAIGAGVGFSIFRLLTVAGNTDQYIFVILVSANLMFASFYLFHGIFQEQPFEILMFIFTTLLIAVFTTMNYAVEETESDKTIKLIRFLVSTILSLPNIILAGIVGWGYWSSGNLVFKTVGGEIKLQKMCRTLFFGYSLLVFDAQAAISCLILVLEHGITEMSQEEIVVVVTGAVFIGMWLTIGFMSMRTENMRLTWLFAVTSVIQPAYVVYLFVKSLEQITGSYSLRTQSAFLAEAVLVVAHFSLLAILPTISFNYGNGLRGKIYGEFTPEGSPLPGSSRTILMKDEDMEPLIEPTTPRQNYQSTVEAIVTVH